MVSKQPRKQRKSLYTMPIHKRRKQMGVRLDKKLAAEHGKRNFPITKGDKVKVFVGKYKGKEGKVMQINASASTVGIEKVTIKKADGTETFIPIHSSNVIITELKISDPRRQRALGRK